MLGRDQVLLWWSRCCLVWLSLAVMAVQGLADAPPSPTQKAGLMWNRTGLPAVFPLQVKTSSGLDYRVTLIDAATGAEALAAYIEGGAFFKVLVPPGRFEIHFAAGRTWQGEGLAFGPGDETQRFVLPEPLTFAVRDFSTKAGHLIDLTDVDLDGDKEITVAERLICQRLRLVNFPRRQAPFDASDPLQEVLPDQRDDLISPDRYRAVDDSDDARGPVVPTNHAPYFSRPEFDVRKRLC